MKQEISDKIFGYIDALAQKMGVAAEVVMQVLVKQMVLEGIVYTCLFVVLFSVLTPLFIKFLKKADFDAEINSFGVGAILLGMVLTVVTIAACFILPDCIMKIANPGYYAIKTILEAVSVN